MKIAEVDGLLATASDGNTTHTIDLALTGALPVGTWVLTHLGAAREVIEESDAIKIQAALDALRGIMAGTGPGEDAFADLEARGPQLPPHLQAAHAAGKTTA